MFNRPPKEKQPIDIAIDATFDAYDPEGDDAHKHLKSLKLLHTMKAQTGPKAASADTKLMVAGNIVGILLIVGYERSHVVTSKALQFLKQAR